MRIIRTKADGKQPSALKICIAVSKEKGFSETMEIIAGKQQSHVRNLVEHVVTPKSSFLCKKYKKQPKTSQKWLVFGCFLVEVAGLELAASSTRNWRATNCATPRFGEKYAIFRKWSNMWSDRRFAKFSAIGSAKKVSVFKGFQRFSKNKF